MPNISNIIKGFLDVANAAQSTVDKSRILDLVSQVQQISAELDSLREENKMLREQLAKRKKMERIGGACYILEDDGAKTGPICPQCYAEDGIVMLLESDSHGASCSRCGTRYAGVASSIEGPRAMVSY